MFIHGVLMLTWIVIAAATSPIWGTAIWVFWESYVLPKRIPEREIAALADDLIRQHGERAAEIAYINEDRAWRYSDGFEQGKGRRVKQYLQGQSE